MRPTGCNFLSSCSGPHCLRQDPYTQSLSTRCFSCIDRRAAEKLPSLPQSVASEETISPACLSGFFFSFFSLRYLFSSACACYIPKASAIFCPCFAVLHRSCHISILAESKADWNIARFFNKHQQFLSTRAFCISCCILGSSSESFPPNCWLRFACISFSCRLRLCIAKANPSAEKPSRRQNWQKHLLFPVFASLFL